MLFESIPIEEGYEDLTPGIITFPVSLSRYYELFLANNAPFGNEKYLTEKDETNKINFNTEWSTPKEAMFIKEGCT